MLTFFNLTAFIFVLSYLVDIEFLFFNEELLIALSMLLLFFLIVNNFRGAINFFLFLKIEYIYYFFFYFIKLNKKLNRKLLNFIIILKSKLNKVFGLDLLAFYLDFITILNKNIFLFLNFVFNSYLDFVIYQNKVQYLKTNLNYKKLLKNSVLLPKDITSVLTSISEPEILLEYNDIDLVESAILLNYDNVKQ